MKKEEAKVGAKVKDRLGNEGTICKIKGDMCCVDSAVCRRMMSELPWYHYMELYLMPESAQNRATK